jgi:hypothetical protein
VDGTDGVASVVIAREQHLGFGLADFAFEPLDESAQFAQTVRILARFGEFKEHARVGNRRLETLLATDDAFQAAALLQSLLRLFLIVPEVLRGGLRLDTFQLVLLRRDIKETSRVARRARANRRNCCATLELLKSPTLNLQNS